MGYFLGPMFTSYPSWFTIWGLNCSKVNKIFQSQNLKLFIVQVMNILSYFKVCGRKIFLDLNFAKILYEMFWVIFEKGYSKTK